MKDKIQKKFCRLDKLSNGVVPTKIFLNPFVVSKEKKILYFHIPKTGGSSIYKLMELNGLNDGVLSGRNVEFERKVDYFNEVLEEWDDYYKFTFVRNKYDLLISHYHYDQTNPRILQGRSFEQFIKEYVCAEPDHPWWPCYDFWLDQHYITTVDNKEIFNFVAKFDNYAADLEKICTDIKIPFQNIKANIGRYDKTKNRDFYYTEELKNLVTEKFKTEIEHFNFTYEQQ